MTKNTKFVIGFAAAVLIAGGSVVGAQDRLIQQGTDPATGAIIRVYRTAKGARVDVETSTLLLRKESSPTEIVTTMKSGRESLIVAISADRLSVRGTRGAASASAADQRALPRAKQLVAESPLSSKVSALIGRLGLGAASPLHPMLLTTRAFLLAARDDDSGTRELSARVTKSRPATQVTKVAFQSRTPTQCWDDYNKELEAAWDAYEYCMDNVKWWNPFGTSGCNLKYEFRIVAAFTWYLDCVKILGFIIG